MDRYIDRSSLDKYNKNKIIIYIGLGIVLLPMIVILIAGIDEGETHMIVVASVLIAVLLLEAFAFVWISILFFRAGRYAALLEEDHDGVITYQRIHEMTGYSLNRIRKDFDWLSKKGKLHNAVIDDEKVILWSDTEYLDVTCATCGAVNQVRFGSSHYCKHCGSYLRRV